MRLVMKSFLATPDILIVVFVLFISEEFGKIPPTTTKWRLVFCIASGWVLETGYRINTL